MNEAQVAAAIDQSVYFHVLMQIVQQRPICFSKLPDEIRSRTDRLLSAPVSTMVYSLQHEITVHIRNETSNAYPGS
jgi:hypothetical protein